MDFKKELLFELIKDKQIYNAANFKREIMNEYDIPLGLARELFIRVNNYQLRKYGDILVKRVYKRRKVRGTNGVYTFKEV